VVESPDRNIMNHLIFLHFFAEDDIISTVTWLLAWKTLPKYEHKDFHGIFGVHDLRLHKHVRLGREYASTAYAVQGSSRVSGQKQRLAFSHKAVTGSGRGFNYDIWTRQWNVFKPRRN
jgi:hypothetical protein